MATRVVSKTINLDAPIEEVSKYITTITADNGIQIHQENFNENNSNYIQLDNNGLKIKNGSNVLAKYGAETIIGSEDNYHIAITSGTPDNPNDPPMLKFLTGGEDSVVVAYISNEELNIPRVVVLDSMKVGKWKWDGQSNENHLTLRWNG